MKAIYIALGLLLATCLASTSLSAQWVKQTLPTTVGTPHMTYPGTHSAPQKDLLWLAALDFLPDTTRVLPLQTVRTADAGRTWQVSTVVPNASDLYYSLTPVNNQIAYLSTSNYNTGESIVYRTTNGGNTWQALAVRPHTFLNTSIFFDAQNGLLVCDPDSLGAVFLHTADGGNTWTRGATNNLPKNRPQEFFDGTNYQRIGNTLFSPTYDFETGEKRFWRSLDRGKTWTAGEWYADSESILILNFIFTDDRHGIAVAGFKKDDKVYSTTDGGATWQYAGKTPALLSGGPMGYLPGTHQIVGIFTDDARKMLFSAITNDHGKTWHSHKDLSPYKLDPIYEEAFGVAAFAWTNFEIIDNRTAWAKFSRTEFYRYDGSAPLVPEQPDLDLALAADHEGLPLWSSVKYTLTVTNRGIAKASAVRIDWLPPYKRTNEGADPFAFQAGYASKGRLDTWRGIWTVPELDPGESATATYHLYVVKNNADVTQSAQVMAVTERDVDSAPGNMTATSTEDDEVRFISKAPQRLDGGAEARSTSPQTFLSISPNPAHERAFFTIADASAREWSLRVLNEAGQLVHAQTGRQVQVAELNTAALPAGHYTVHFDNGTTQKVERLVVQH